MINVFLTALLVVTSAQGDLDKATSYYSKAAGIQWTMESEVHSLIFDETEKTPVEFSYNSPDTFYFKSTDEEIIGIADTIWVLSKKHHQIQKKLTEDSFMPTDIFLKWKSRYEMKSRSKVKGGTKYNLKAHEGITPSDVSIVIDKKNHLKSLSYKDSSGNDVKLSVKKEKLVRNKNIRLFYQNIPPGYKLIDLTE